MPSDLSPLWALDPTITFLNHGSFGACPRDVLEAQRGWRDRMEWQPIQFLSRDLPGLLAEARTTLAAFVGADPADLAFVTNATGAVNAVIRSLPFVPGDELLTTDHEYNATINVLRHVAERDGASVVVARIPFPTPGPDAVVEAILAAVTERTRFALVSHVTSPTALVFPVERIVAAGNLHKWVCAPKGAAFLHARRDRQPGIRPNTISHGANAVLGGSGGQGAWSRYRVEFDWQGTLDPTPWLAAGDALRFVGGLIEGGWPAIMHRNRELTLDARRVMATALGVDDATLSPPSMLGSMVALPLPAAGPLAMAGTGSSPLDTDPLQQVLLDRFRIEVPIGVWPVPAAESPDPPRRLIRVSSALHNGADDAQLLADALRTIAAGR